MAYVKDTWQKSLPETPISRHPPRLPPLPVPQFQGHHYDATDSPVSPLFDSTTPLYGGNDSASNSRETIKRENSRPQGPERYYSETIPLAENAQPFAGGKEDFRVNIDPVADPSVEPSRPTRRRTRENKKPKPFVSFQTTWVVYFLSLVQATVFIVELVKNALYTSTPIQIKPQINPMIGPSYYVLINMGGRYVPCMKSPSLLGLNSNIDPAEILWPCPWSTTNNASDPSMQCQLSDLCGFPPFGNPPNQWFRFIIPIFLHVGIIHIGFNLLLQLTLGRDVEKKIGHVRFLFVYMASGIFGFVLGGNFAASGIVSMGCSGSLFGIIAINLLDLLYTWKEKRSPWKDLIFIIIDIVISFVLGLLPGLDNFSHIGGFLMGLVSGLCLLRSPNIIRETISNDVDLSPPTNSRKSRRQKPAFKEFTKDPLDFFAGRKALWWAWWIVRACSLIGVLVCFIVLLNNFYHYSNTCTWCRYLSCLPVNNWCDIGNLNAQLTNITTPANQPRDLFTSFSGF